MIDMNNINDNTEPVEVNSCLNSNHTTLQWETGLLLFLTEYLKMDLSVASTPFETIGKTRL